MEKNLGSKANGFVNTIWRLTLSPILSKKFFHYKEDAAINKIQKLVIWFQLRFSLFSLRCFAMGSENTYNNTKIIKNKNHATSSINPPKNKCSWWIIQRLSLRQIKKYVLKANWNKNSLPTSSKNIRKMRLWKSFLILCWSLTTLTLLTLPKFHK
jgi:hypothetical protein